MMQISYFKLNSCSVWTRMPQYSIGLEALAYSRTDISVRLSEWACPKISGQRWRKAHRSRRRMVQSYSPGGSSVSSHEGTLAPPGKYDWTSASFGPLESTTQRVNRSVQPFLHSSRAESPDTLQWAPLSTSINPSHGGCGLPSNTWFLDHMRAQNPNDMSIGLAVFAQMIADYCPYTLNVFPSKLPPCHGGSGPHVIHGSLGLPESSTQTATRSLQPFLQGWLVWLTDILTDRPTDHATESV